MYKVESYNNELDNFHEFLRKYIIDLEKELDNTKNSTFYSELIDKINSANSASEILELKDDVVKIESSLKNRFDVISFYVSNDASNAPQVLITIDYIKNSGIIDKIKTIISNNQNVNDIEREIKKCKDILSNNITDYDYYFSLIEKSNLSEEEKLAILSKIAYESTIKKVKRTRNVSSTRTSKYESKYKYINEDELKEKYYELRGNLLGFRNKYKYLLDGKTDNQIEMYSNIVKGLGQDFVSHVSNYAVKEETMNLLNAKTILLINEIDSFIQVTKNNRFTNEDAEMYEIYLEEMKELLGLYETLDKKFEIEKEEMKDRSYSKVLFLTDENNELLFNIEKLNVVKKKAYATLLQKLENGQFDIKSHREGTTVLGTKKYNIYVNTFGNIACSYIVIDDEHILILTFESRRNIYSRSLIIEKNNSNRIMSIKDSALEDFEKIFESQGNIRLSIAESLKISDLNDNEVQEEGMKL